MQPFLHAAASVELRTPFEVAVVSPNRANDTPTAVPDEVYGGDQRLEADKAPRPCGGFFFGTPSICALSNNVMIPQAKIINGNTQF